MEENTRALAEGGTEREKVPSDLVVVPVEVPLMRTETFAKPVPLASVAFPETVLFWAKTCPNSSRQLPISSRSFLMSVLILVSEINEMLNIGRTPDFKITVE